MSTGAIISDHETRQTNTERTMDNFIDGGMHFREIDRIGDSLSDRKPYAPRLTTSMEYRFMDKNRNLSLAYHQQSLRL